MKDLRYIKLFEAFESKFLAKTLSAIEDKDAFILMLKLICNRIDFPVSKLNDDYFEYLPFNKALRRINDVEKCKASNEDGFSCEDGKIGMKWYTKKGEEVIKKTTCSACKGNGVIHKDGMKLIKFWFNKDGEFISMTGVDGSKRSGMFAKFFGEVKGYNIVKPLSNKDVAGLEPGSIIYFHPSGYKSSIIGYIYKDGGRVFAIQSYASGSTPEFWNRSATSWNKIAPCSWNMVNGDFYDVSLLEETKQSNESGSSNNLNYNLSITIQDNEIQYSHPNSVTNIDELLNNQLKGAHFAIIMNLEKLKHSEHDLKSSIASTRSERKLGIPKDSDVKNNNMLRYLGKLSEIDVRDISTLSRYIRRFIISRNVLYIMFVDNFISDIQKVYTSIMKLYPTKDTLGLIDDSRAEDLNGLIKSQIAEMNIRNLNVIKNLDYYRENFKKLYEQNPEWASLCLELLDSFDNLGKVIYDRITSEKIESIDDFRGVINIIRNIINECDNSNIYQIPRFRDLFRFMAAVHSVNPEDGYYHLNTRDRRRIESSIIDTKTIIAKINK